MQPDSRPAHASGSTVARDETPARRTSSARARLVPRAMLGVMILGGLLAARGPIAAEAPAAPPATATFQIVVNAANPTTEIAAAKVARMFLKKLKRWDHGPRIQPVNLEADSPIRGAFTKAVHGKSVTAIKMYWQRMLFSGRDVPPTETLSEAAALELISESPGAIGYVAAETELGTGVKKLIVSP